MPQNITLHIKTIYADVNRCPRQPVRNTYKFAKRETAGVKRALKHYNLDVVLAVGYRVRSHRGTQFRQWATTNLRLMAQSLNMIVKSIIYAMVVS
jgi:hypothetical protein